MGDIFNDGPKNNQPDLVNCANFTGQFWNILLTQDDNRRRSCTQDFS